MIVGTAYSQVSTYTQSTPFDTIMATPDSLFYEFTAVQIGATGTLTLVVYFEGDFGANSEYISFYDEGGYLIGVTQPYFNGNDCMVDSTLFTIPASYITSWSADDTIKIMELHLTK